MLTDRVFHTTTEMPSTRQSVSIREVASVLAVVVLADLTLYRGHGFTGVAAFLAGTAALFVLAMNRPQFRTATWLVLGMLVLLAARTVWLGSPLGVLGGFTLLVALSIALSGRPPHVLTVGLQGLQSIANGYQGLLDYGAWAARMGPRSRQIQWLAFMLPLAAIGLFGMLFVFANPDLVAWVSRLLDSWLMVLDRWWNEIPFHAREVLFWGVVAWLVIGLVRPRKPSVEIESVGSELFVAGPAEYQSPLYVPLRNTLLSVIVLFAIYLIFEFRTLWFREFPEGFYYAGYAHEGAAWLTTALAFSTLMLSLIFRGPLLNDGRLPRLRTLAWIWSAQNLLLAATVFNRLQIYVNFNGMTRMRMVALFGTATVVAGFMLVVWKIVRNRNFAWLVKHQLLALAVAVYLFAITPIDAIVHTYNVRQVMSGQLAPVVQIAVHPIDSQGVLMLKPLLDCPDATIRDGVRALFAQRAGELTALQNERSQLGWTTFQEADRRCLEMLLSQKPRWSDLEDDRRSMLAWEQFYSYAYQWY